MAVSTDPKLIGLLSRHESIEPQAISVILGSNGTQPLTKQPGETIIKEDEVDRTKFFILLRGIARVERSVASETDPKTLIGRHVAIRQPGEQMGLTPALAGTPHDGNTIALTRVNYLEVQMSDFLVALQISKILLRKVARSQANRFTQYAFRTELLYSDNNVAKYATFLAELHMAIEENSGRGMKIEKIVLERGIIADLLGMSDETLRKRVVPHFRATEEQRAMGMEDAVRQRVPSLTIRDPIRIREQCPESFKRAFAADRVGI